MTPKGRDRYELLANAVAQHAAQSGSPWGPTIAVAALDTAAELRAASDACPGVETVPNLCACDCEGCKHHCGAHRAATAPDAEPGTPDLREQYAAAMREHYLVTDRAEADAEGRMPCRCGDWREPGDMDGDEYDWAAHLAEACATVRDDALTTAQRAAEAAEHIARRNKEHADLLARENRDLRQRAEAAEQRITAVLAECDRIEGACTPADSDTKGAYLACLRHIRAALAPALAQDGGAS